MNLSIRMNERIDADACPLCGAATNPNIGPELVMEETALVVCRDCGRIHAPALVVLLELAEVAETLSLHTREFGQMWQASRGVSASPGLDWNASLFGTASQDT
jgi:hypothetical protein